MIIKEEFTLTDEQLVYLLVALAAGGNELNSNKPLVSPIEAETLVSIWKQFYVPPWQSSEKVYSNRSILVLIFMLNRVATKKWTWDGSTGFLVQRPVSAIDLGNIDEDLQIILEKNGEKNASL